MIIARKDNPDRTLEVTPEQWETLKELEGRHWKVLKGASVEEMTRSKVKPDVAIPLNVKQIIDAGKIKPLTTEPEVKPDEQITKKPRNKKGN